MKDEIVNTQVWIAECRKHCENSIRNTSAGAWLDCALRRLEEATKLLQESHNREIDLTHELQEKRP